MSKQRNIVFSKALETSKLNPYQIKSEQKL